MASITLETTANLPTNSSLSIVVEEDIDGNGTADNAATATIADGTNTQSLSGFDASSGNYFRVRPDYAASSIALGSTPSVSATVSPPVSAPSTPQNLTSTVSADDISLDWDPVNWNGDEDHYNVYRAQATGGPYTEIAQVSAGTTTYTDSALEDGERFYYVVEAENSEGTSNKSNETDEITGLPAASSVSASLTNNENDISVSWTNNDDSGDGGIDVERSTDGFSTLTTVASGLSTSTTSYTDSTVSEDTSYEYRIERNTDHATATSATTSSLRVPKDLSRTATLTGDGSLSVTRSGITKSRANAVTSDGAISVTRVLLKSRDPTVTGDGTLTVTRDGITKPRATTNNGDGDINVRAEFTEVFPDEQTNDIAWDFSFDDPFGFVSEWVPEETLFDEDSDAFTVVVDSYIDKTYELGVEYDEDGDGVAEYRTETQNVHRDGQTLVFPSLGESGQYRLYIQYMRPNDHLRAVTIAPTRY